MFYAQPNAEGPKTEKVLGTNSGRSGLRNLEDELIRSRAERMGGCAKLMPTTEIRLPLQRRFSLAVE